MILPLHLGIGAKVCCLKRPAWDCVFLPKDKKVDLGRGFPSSFKYEFILLFWKVLDVLFCGVPSPLLGENDVV